ncbi:MAG: zinc ribbon domain-containing protein [Pseudomonadales bacterium]
MPIYEYQCQKCGHEFEAIQKVSDEPLRQCPACSEEALRKKISAAGFRLKGGGWYETDFKAGKKKNIAGEEKSSTSTDSGDSAKKSSPAESSSGGSGGAATKSSTES